MIAINGHIILKNKLGVSSYELLAKLKNKLGNPINIKDKTDSTMVDEAEEFVFSSQVASKAEVKVPQT